MNAVGGREPSSLPLRHSHTRNLILGAARDKTRARTLLDHPVLRLTVAGHPVYLEPDIVAFQHHETFHIVEIESFPVIDGQADPAKVAAALTQAAAYVLALRELLAEGASHPSASPTVWSWSIPATSPTAHRDPRRRGPEDQIAQLASRPAPPPA
ncbi:hypothetical protein [Streptomyces sp. XD-27]|uniref:hypothetical protein n=1 Tax=Streptomyces sp. XD-27 TaxID=3062779 RepID=UPI0026F40DEA|nr:hypothetical protein [Streptomyces sp. XD-27]WKX74077.1 hypothetical protein Q3Y56_33225 [Streptomyces sp. XD-27]